jgi:hypothetical protein
MEVPYPHCARLNVRKDTVTGCVRHTVDATVKREVKMFSATTAKITLTAA